MGVMTWLREQSERARTSGLPIGAESFPEAVRRFFTNVSGYEPAEFVRRLIPATARQVLVVGVGAGRDAYWLRMGGLRVVSIDIAEQGDVPNLIVADMADLSLRSRYFDVVVVADALEHTLNDLNAIHEFGRVLVPRGKMILNVPFGDDKGEHHVRVYSEATLRRLLAYGGFRIDERLYRGWFPIIEQNVPGVRTLLHGAALVAKVLGRELYTPVMHWCIERDWNAAHHAHLRRYYRGHGAYIGATYTGEIVDYMEINRKEYRNQRERLGWAAGAIA